MTVTGVTPEKVWLPPGIPARPNDMLLPTADLLGWEAFRVHWRLKADSRNIWQLRTPTGWEDIFDQGIPPHWDAEHTTKGPVLNTASWQNAENIPVPVIAGHRYLVAGTLNMSWTGVSVDGMSARLQINGVGVGRQTFPSARKSSTYHRATVITAPTTGTIDVKLQWGSDSAHQAMRLEMSRLDIVELR
jgi:hypothetical protein